MFDQHDIQLLQGMFIEHRTIIIREVRDEIHSVVNAAVSASEGRLIKRMDEMERRINE